MRLTTLAAVPKKLTRWVLLTGVLSFISGCSSDNQQSIVTQAVQLTHGIDKVVVYQVC